MRIELSPESRAKIEDILEEMAVRYSLEELTPDELIDALLDLGVDLVVGEEPSMPLGRDRLIDYCGRKIVAR